MKKILFLSIVSLGLFTASQAQIGISSQYKPKPFAASSNGITFGLKLGANGYQLGGSDADDFKESRKIKIGIAGGVIVNIPMTSMFVFQPGIMYSSQGNLQKEGDLKATVALAYLNVPLIVQLHTTSGFFVEAGPQIGFLMSGKIKYDDGTDEDETDIKDELKGIDFAVALGLGYKTKSGFGIGGRYNIGLSTIIDEDDSKVTNQGFHIGVFYVFGGSK